LRSSSIFSTVSVIEESRPITPPISTHQALSTGTHVPAGFTSPDSSATTSTDISEVFC
jgi:hypothetical protein